MGIGTDSAVFIRNTGNVNTDKTKSKEAWGKVADGLENNDTRITVNEGKILDLETKIDNVKVFDTVAELQAATGLVEGDIVEVLGFYVKGDGAYHQRKIETIQKKGSISVGAYFANIVPIFVGDVYPIWFGAKGDGVLDDTSFFQTAIEYCIENKVNFKGFAGRKYYITSKILIPKNVAFDKIITIDGENVEMLINSDITVFESAYYDNGILTSNFLESGGVDLNPSFLINLKNFFIKHSNPATLCVNPALRIQDWHQHTNIENIKTINHYTQLHSFNNFYCNFKNCNGYSNFKGDGTPMFRFGGQVNLNIMEGLVALNTDVGYLFESGVTATTFRNNSLEGQTIAMLFESEVFNISVEGNYCKAWTDTLFKFNSYVDKAVFSNNYINFVNASGIYVFDYTPLPLVNIIFDDTNILIECPEKDSQLIKTINETPGLNNLTIKYPFTFSNEISSLIKDNSKISSQVNVDGTIGFAGYRSNLVNKYCKGNYSGRMTDGHTNQNGFKWIDNSNSTLTIDTAIEFSFTQEININIEVTIPLGPTYIVGKFIGNKFYQLTDTGFAYDSTFTQVPGNVTVPNKIRFQKAMPDTISSVKGEIRII